MGKEIALDRLEWRGAFSCRGLASADTIILGLYGMSHIGELAGASIDVRREGTSLEWLTFFKSPSSKRLTVEEVSGDDIRLESTHAHIVRGDRVVIGEKCRVDRVEYRQGLDIHESSVVTEQVKIK